MRINIFKIDLGSFSRIYCPDSFSKLESYGIKMKKYNLFIVILLIICTMTLFAACRTQKEDDSITIASILVSETQIIFEHNGLSEFIDVIANLSNGETQNISNWVRFYTSDQEVAIAVGRRILARGNGSTELHIEYGDFKTIIPVKVLAELDLESLMGENKTAISNSSNLTAAEREAIIVKASAMYNVEWTPNQTLTSFNNMWTYRTDQTYNIPYSQTANQIDDIQLKEVMNNKDFYDSYKRYLSPYKSRIVMPKYGCDCSGFVSMAWNVKRESSSTFISKIQKGKYPIVGSYDPVNPSYSELINAYSGMSSGDAIVRLGHVILIGENHSDYAYCYEQLGLEIELTYWTHSDLADRGYMPFSRE